MARKRSMGMSIEAFARYAQSQGERITAQAIGLRIRDGSIPVLRDGTLNPEAALKALREASPAESRPKGTNGASVNGASQHYSTARAARMVTEARIRQLEYDRMRGELVSVSAVHEQATESGRRLKAMLLALPARLGVYAPDGQRAAFMATLDREVRMMITEVAGTARD